MENNNNITSRVKKYLSTHKVIAELVFILICLFLALPVALISYSGLFRSVDHLVEDSLYQRGSTTEPGIVIVKITVDDVKTYGLNNDANKRMLELLTKLYEDENNKPCVVGIDYQLEDKADLAKARELAEFCKDKPIVLNNIMSLQTNLTIGDDGYFGKNQEVKIKNSGDPYYELKSVTDVGYSNLFYDTDGTLRHYSWQFVDVFNKVYPSFAKAVYDKYIEEKDITTEPVRTIGDNVTYISYYGAPNRFPSYTLTEMLTGSFDSSKIADKVVLVGAYDSTLTQGYITSISKQEMMYNVEIQANAIGNAIDNRQIVEIPLIVQLTFLELLTAIAIYILLKCKFVWASIYLFVALFVNLALSNLSWAIGHPFHLLYLTASYIVCYMVCLGIGFQKEKSSKTLIIDKFEKVIDKNITDAILDEENENSAEPVNKNVCIMFADLRNFTAVSSSMESKDLVAMLNRYFTEASICIKENEGTIDKFNGDAIMAIWGAPNDVDDCVFKACKAALEITQKIETLNKKIYEEFDRSLSFGIGINYGEATVGRVGSKDHKEFTAIGDLVNVASRVESLAPRGCVFITEVVKNKLGNRARISSFDHRYSIKGKTDPIEVYLLEAVDPRPGYYNVQKINEVKNDSKH